MEVESANHKENHLVLWPCLALNWSPKTKWFWLHRQKIRFHFDSPTISLIIFRKRRRPPVFVRGIRKWITSMSIQTKVHKALAQNSHQYLAPKRWHLLECNAETIERIVPFITLDCFISQFSKDHYYYPSKECIIALTEKSLGKQKRISPLSPKTGKNA